MPEAADTIKSSSIWSVNVYHDLDGHDQRQGSEEHADRTYNHFGSRRLSLFSPTLVTMSASASSRALADRLTTACHHGDLPSAETAVADGASVNEAGWGPWGGAAPPLAAAVAEKHHDVVVWLLSHGAAPNGEWVMYDGARLSTAGILQLLIDAGGNVNRRCGPTRKQLPPLFSAMFANNEDTTRLLLAQPLLDVSLVSSSKTPEQWARDSGWLAGAAMIAQEVSGNGCPCCCLVGSLYRSPAACAVRCSW